MAQGKGTGGRKRGEAKPSAQAAADTQAAESGSPPPPTPDSLLEVMQGQTFDTLESLSRTLAETTIRAQQLGAEMVGKAAHDSGRPFRPDPYGLSPYAAEVMGKIAARPEKLLDAQAELWRGYAQIWTEAAKSAFGEPMSPVRKDKRFADPDWERIPFFDLLRRTYLHTSDWMVKLVESAEGVDEMSRRKALFFTRQIADAFSPSNFIATNPQVLRETLASKGENLARGITHLVEDMERGHGRIAIRQTDETRFEVGRNIAITPGKVVYRGELFELLQYAPATEQVYETPILFFPPWINKFYILDLRQDNSMIKWLTEQGYTVFVVSWVNPDPSMAEKTFEDYMRGGIWEAVDAARKAAGVEKVNCVGYCIGGTLLACTLAVMAQRGDDRINAVTFFASQQDFVEAGDLLVFTDESAMQYIKDEIEARKGVLGSDVMAETFNFLRANDLVWSFVVNNYLLGKEPAAFDLLFWNSDQTRMPRALHLFYLDTFYRKNALTNGELVMDGLRLSLKDVKNPVYMQSSRDDHIAPYRSIFRGARQFGGPMRMILAGSGHIAGVINHPDANKYQHWLPKDDAPLPDTVEVWQAGLLEHKGSWWPDWDRWLASHSGPKVAAREPGTGALPALCDAPGTYVKVKSEQ
jgi:polyhydroxyalkanoate synthase subunit PhaC